MKTRYRIRRFIPSSPQHVYQISKDHGLIFYSNADFIVFTCLIFCKAEKYKVKITQLCLMPNHIHIQLVAPSLNILVRFESELTSSFTMMYNKEMGRSGRLFARPFGSAPKSGGHSIKTNTVYLLNNPVVKHMCKNPVEYRWNFLSYALSDNPFSKPYIVRHSSKYLRHAMKIADEFCKRKAPVTYDFLHRMEEILETEELMQLYDRIVSNYLSIDWSYQISLFGSIQDMVISANANIGKEFDLNEIIDSSSYVPFQQMLAQYYKKGFKGRNRSPYLLSEKQISDLIMVFRKETDADIRHISAFLHISPDRVAEDYYYVFTGLGGY